MKAELLEVFGDDLMIVNAARVSYGKHKSRFDQSDARLLKYLKEHGHTSPFRHPQLQFRLHVPIFVERQLFKHQVGLTANSISGRYVDFSDEYYTPTEFRIQSKDSKQGSSDEKIDYLANQEHIKKYESAINKIRELYDYYIDNGIAKEQARIVLPLSLYTTFIWTGSLAAYLNLFDLRLKPDAQQETREVVGQMLDLVRLTGKFNYTLEAWGYGKTQDNGDME
ncbi:MAG: FAD-dependent thymidylate synthase [Chitinophagaceae bacterium]